MRFSIKGLILIGCLFTSALNCYSLDREAFTFTNYDLQVRIEPDQHRLGVRGKVTLRNDSAIAQKIAVLQVSSSLDWRSVTAASRPLQFVSQPYTSDIDHTGALSEAIVTLPQAIAPKAAIDLDVAYEGVIVLDTTRLTRIGAPEAEARNSDWDQIGASFTAVRGVGYVAWYPIATESANLSDLNSVSNTVGRSKVRSAESRMSCVLEATRGSTILFGGTPDLFTMPKEEGISTVAVFSIVRLGMNVPTFVIADYKKMDVKGLYTVDFLPGNEKAAASYADVLGDFDSLPAARGPRRLQVVELPHPDAASFVTESMLLTPLKQSVTEEDRLTTIYALAKQRDLSPRPWITEGLAHLAQVMDIERQRGRKAALDYLDAHRTLLTIAEGQTNLANASLGQRDRDFAVTHSLLGTTDEVYLQSKALWVWSMLRDMIGDTRLRIVLFAYEGVGDKEPTYVQRILEKTSQRDLEWFFDDWVYRDHGLPDFKVESAFSRKTLSAAYVVTVTVDNLGAAGAEVPVTVKFSGGEVTKRLEVRARNKAVIRVEVPTTPQEVVLNDGSVPESDTTNNVFKIETSETEK